MEKMIGFFTTWICFGNNIKSCKLIEQFYELIAKINYNRHLPVKMIYKKTINKLTGWPWFPIGGI